MKTIIILACVTASTALAATMTIDVPDAQVPRILEAYGSIYSLGRNATAAEVQVMIQGWLQSSTQDYERRKNMVQFTPPPVFSPTPTPGTAMAAAPAKAAPKATPKPTATAKPKKKK
jgi:hypothetical protein